MNARRLRFAPVWLLAAALAVAACSDDDDTPPPDSAVVDARVVDARVSDAVADSTVDASPDAGSPDGPERSCETVFRYEPSGTVGTVQLAGEWDWNTPETMTPDGTGAYTISKTLSAGLYAYKLIVDGDWILDPVNYYRKYDGGVENSGMRVPDCQDPELRLVTFTRTASGATARVQFRRGNGGALSDPSERRVWLVHDFQETAATFSWVDHGFEVDVTGLAPGKYTLRFEAADLDARWAEPLRLPFWVEAEAFDWRDSPIYMIMVDRFRDGDTSNNPAPTSGAEPTADFHGGDLAGITAAINEGYFDNLGIRTLWLSPFVRNPDLSYTEGTHGVTGYHGYWPIRAREVDPRFGTEADLEALVAAAHGHGIRILMDFVINHVHEQHEYYLAHPEWFRTGCKCGDTGCDWTTHRLDCLFQMYMPDVNWEIPEAGEAIIADALWWLERFDLDGLRVDAVKHVEDAAIFNLAIRVAETFEQAGTEHFLLGETAMGWTDGSIADNAEQYGTISRYIGPHALNGQFDFVLYHAVSYRSFAHDSKGLIHADYWAQASLSEYPAYAIMTPYIGSHDTQRFLSLADPAASGVVYNKWPSDGLPAAPSTDEPYQRLQVALAWVLSLPGAPLLYYGDEYGEFGGSDPDNRHWWRPANQRTTREGTLFDQVTLIGQTRRDSEALRRGDYTSVLGEETFLVFARHTATDVALVALNRSGAPITRALTLPASLPTVASYRDALRPSDPAIAVSGGNGLTITVPAYSAAIFIPAP